MMMMTILTMQKKPLKMEKMKTLKLKKIKKRESKSKKKDIRNSGKEIFLIFKKLGRNSERTLNWELLKINKTEKN